MCQRAAFKYFVTKLNDMLRNIWEVIIRDKKTNKLTLVFCLYAVVSITCSISFSWGLPLHDYISLLFCLPLETLWQYLTKTNKMTVVFFQFMTDKIVCKVEVCIEQIIVTVTGEGHSNTTPPICKVGCIFVI